MSLKRISILTIIFLLQSCQIDFQLGSLYYQSSPNSPNYLYDYMYTGFTDSYYSGLLVFDSTITVDINKVRAKERQKIRARILYRPNKEQTIQVLDLNNLIITDYPITDTKLRIHTIDGFNAAVVSGNFGSNQGSIFYDFERIEETTDALVFFNIKNHYEPNQHIDTLCIKKGPIKLEAVDGNISKIIVKIPATEHFSSGVYLYWQLFFTPTTKIPAQNISNDGVFKQLD